MDESNEPIDDRGLAIVSSFYSGKFSGLVLYKFSLVGGRSFPPPNVPKKAPASSGKKYNIVVYKIAPATTLHEIATTTSPISFRYVSLGFLPGSPLLVELESGYDPEDIVFEKCKNQRFLQKIAIKKPNSPRKK